MSTVDQAGINFDRKEVDHLITIISLFKSTNDKLNYPVHEIKRLMQGVVDKDSPIMEILRKRPHDGVFKGYADMVSFLEENGITGFPPPGKQAEENIASDDPRLLALLNGTYNPADYEDSPERIKMAQYQENAGLAGLDDAKDGVAPIAENSNLVVSEVTDDDELHAELRAFVEGGGDYNEGSVILPDDTPLPNVVDANSVEQDVQVLDEKPGLEGGFVMPTDEQLEAMVAAREAQESAEASEIGQLPTSEGNDNTVSKEQTDEVTSEQNEPVTSPDTGHADSGADKVEPEPEAMVSDMNGYRDSDLHKEYARVQGQDYAQNVPRDSEMPPMANARGSQGATPGGNMVKIGPFGMMLYSLLNHRSAKREIAEQRLADRAGVDRTENLLKNKHIMLDNSKEQLMTAMTDFARKVDVNGAPLDIGSVDAATKNIEKLARDYGNRIGDASELVASGVLQVEDQENLTKKIAESKEIRTHIKKLKEEHPDNHDLDRVDSMIKELVEAIQKVLAKIFGKGQEKNTEAAPSM